MNKRDTLGDILGFAAMIAVVLFTALWQIQGVEGGEFFATGHLKKAGLFILPWFVILYLIYVKRLRKRR